VTHAANLISNVTHNLTEAATTIAAVIARTIAAGDDEVEVSADAERAWMTYTEGHEWSFWPIQSAHRVLQQRGRPWVLASLNSSRYPEVPWPTSVHRRVA